jgi:hypothetical protein
MTGCATGMMTHNTIFCTSGVEVLWSVYRRRGKSHQNAAGRDRWSRNQAGNGGFELTKWLRQAESIAVRATTVAMEKQ